MAPGRKRDEGAKQQLCFNVNKPGGCRFAKCRFSHEHKGAQCWAFEQGKPCRHGSKCVYLHGEVHPSQLSNSSRSIATNGQAGPRGGRKAFNLQESKLRQWRVKIQDTDTPLSKSSRSRLLSEALEYVTLDAGTMQSVIISLASDGGLKLVLQTVKEDRERLMPDAQNETLKDTIIPFFKVITYSKVLSSALLENSIGTVYNAIFGPGGQYALKLFRFIAAKAEILSVGDLEPTLAAFSKVLDFNGTAHIIDDFKQILEIFGASIATELAKDDKQDLAMINARQWLERASNRLGVGKPAIEEVLSARDDPKPRPQFDFKVDLPGRLSDAGPRHDNDFEDIRNVQIMPTFQEITCDRLPYLPVIDAPQPHLTGIEGLIDRHFRLYREDAMGPLREALQAELRKQADPRSRSNSGQRINRYSNVALQRLRCHEWHGLVITMTVDQPKEVHNMSDTKRGEWWETRKRLRKDSLTCILDPSGHVIFCTVVEVKIQPRNNRRYDEEDDEEEERVKEETEMSYQDFSTNSRRALFTVSLAEQGDVSTIVDYCTGCRPSHSLTLIEFPKVMLQAFKPTLAVLQSMISTADVPFSDLLAPPSETTGLVDIGPPAYAQQRDFQFDLSCLLNNQQRLVLSPNQEFDTKALIDGSTLDDKQAEALANALCRRLAIIQGPPGTGKSFTALALIRALIANKEAASLGLILTVTYTNHALDQDMEHCLDSGIQHIVRMGSRSKSERLKDLNLRVISKNMERTGPEKNAVWTCRGDMAREAGYVNAAIQSLIGNDDLELFLEENYPEYYQQFWGTDDEGFEYQSSNSRSIVQMWLSGKLGSVNSGSGRRTRTPNQLIDSRVDIREMTHNERKELHAFWGAERYRLRRRIFLSALEEYQTKKQDYDAAVQEVDLRCLGEANIIGVTTSGLARNFNLLKRLPIKALLVEEAGEVLEAHTLTALLPSVEQYVSYSIVSGIDS